MTQPTPTPIAWNGPPPAAPPAPPAVPAAPPAPPTPPAPATGTDPGFPADTPIAEMTDAQRAAYWQHHARRHEATAKSRADYDDLKAKATQWEQLAQASMTEQEKAIEAAKAEARQQAIAEVGGHMVDAQITVASAGRMTDAQRAALLANLDRSRFLKADGTVDGDKVAALVDGIAPAQGAATAPAAPGAPAAPSLGQGARQGSPGPSVADGEALYRSLFPVPTPSTNGQKD